MAVGDLLSIQGVWPVFPVGGPDEPEPDVPTPIPDIRGVPALKPRKRPQTTEISGEGLIAVIGAGALVGEAHLHGSLDQASTIDGEPTREALLQARGQIRSGGEARLVGEVLASADAVLATEAVARAVGEIKGRGEGPIRVRTMGRMKHERGMSGAGEIRTGGEAHLTGFESDYWIIMAAAKFMLDN